MMKFNKVQDKVQDNSKLHQNVKEMMVNIHAFTYILNYARHVNFVQFSL